MAKADNSFDVACKVDPQAVADAVHQATREVQTRYDLKQTKTERGLEKDAITVHTDNDYVLKQVLDVLQSKLHRRGVPLKALAYGKVEAASGGTVRQRIDVQQGIPLDKAREIVRLIKDTKLKVQAQIQEDQVRVFGKNRDDLQAVIKMLREQDLGIEMQFTNYRSE
jgi:cyclic-di-GMP-binding protein